jgi:hypothetical protein
VTASGRGGGPAGGLGSPGRTRVGPEPYPVTLCEDVVVLDRSRAVILDLAAVGNREWRGYYIACAREFAWPDETCLIVDRGGWHATLGGPGCRWSSWSLPEVHDMITRAVKGGR